MPAVLCHVKGTLADALVVYVWPLQQLLQGDGAHQLLPAHCCSCSSQGVCLRQAGASQANLLSIDAGLHTMVSHTAPVVATLSHCDEASSIQLLKLRTY